MRGSVEHGFGHWLVDLKMNVGKDVAVVLKETKVCVLETVIGRLIAVDTDKRVVHIEGGAVFNASVPQIVPDHPAKKIRVKPTYNYVGLGAVEPIRPGKAWAVNWIALASIPGELIQEVVVRDNGLGPGSNDPLGDLKRGMEKILNTPYQPPVDVPFNEPYSKRFWDAFFRSMRTSSRRATRRSFLAWVKVRARRIIP